MDNFFRVKDCQRCNKELLSRTMSWFTDEVICLDCSEKEDELKKKLKAKGSDLRALEGCGYIPEVGGI